MLQISGISSVGVDYDYTLHRPTLGLPEMRKFQNLEPVYYREKEVSEVLKLMQEKPKNPIVVTGIGGAGKSTFLREIFLSMQEKSMLPVSFFDARDHDEAITILDRVRAINTSLERIKELAKNRMRQVIIVDSGDALIQCLYPTDTTMYERLYIKNKTTLLNESELRHLAYYRKTIELLSALKNPNFQIITTSHAEMNPSCIDSTLLEVWNQVFQHKQEYVLSPKLEVDKGIAYIVEHVIPRPTTEDLQVIRAIATHCNWINLKYLERPEYEELKAKLLAHTKSEWDNVLGDWVLQMKDVNALKI